MQVSQLLMINNQYNSLLNHTNQKKEKINNHHATVNFRASAKIGTELLTKSASVAAENAKFAVPGVAALLGLLHLNNTGNRELSNDEVNNLTLYFHKTKRNNKNTKTFIAGNNDTYTEVIKDVNDHVIERIPLEAKKDHGQDAHIAGDVYRNLTMSEQEKAEDNRRYLKTGRQRYYNSEAGDINKVQFNIPVVKNRPLRVAFVAFDPRGEDKVSFSVGVNYLEAALKNKFEDNVDVANIDDQLVSTDEIKKRLEEYKPDLIGISSKIYTYQKSSPFIDYCSKAFPNSLIVAGGTTPTYAFREILDDHPNILVSAGNGEKSICEIADIMLGNKPEENIFYVPNIVLKQNDNKIIMSKQVTDDLDIKPTDTNLPEILKKDGIIYLRLSQGCWGHCTFCSQPEKWESAKIDEVVDTLKEWQDKYGLKGVSFTDDEMVPHDPKEAIDRLDYFSAKMIEKNVNVNWTMNLRADAINFLDNEEGERILKQLKDSHCAGFFLGIESGSDNQLKRYAKQVAPMPTNVEVNKKILNRLRDSGLPVTAGFIMFDPLMPTLKEITENLKFFDDNDLLNLHSRLNNNMRVEKGTNYIQMVANMQLGLLGELQPNLLTYDSKYLDPRVGTIKEHINVFIEEIRPQYELIYNARYRLNINPDIELQKQLEMIEREVKQITRDYVADMIKVFDVSEEDELIDKKGIHAFSKEFWKTRIERLTEEVNTKIPELYELRQKYKEKLNVTISKLDKLNLS